MKLQLLPVINLEFNSLNNEGGLLIKKGNCVDTVDNLELNNVSVEILNKIKKFAETYAEEVIAVKLFNFREQFYNILEKE